MSVKVMERVWSLNLPQNQKLVLLAYADHADPEGGSIFPAIRSVCAKTGYSRRSVQAITRQLEAAGLLVQEGRGPHGTNRWRIPLPVEAEPNPAITEGVETVPAEPAGAESAGAITARAETARVQNPAAGGAAGFTPGVQPVTPEPSLTVIQPSESTTTAAAQGAVFKVYENEIGCLTPLIADKIGGYLDDPKCPRDWVIEAIQEAARQNKRNWAYCEAILNRWRAEGKQSRLRPPDPSRPRHRARKRESLQRELSPEELARARSQAEKELLPCPPT